MTRRFFMIAGEPSGDRLGAALIEGLRARVEGPVDFEGVGGTAMASAGLTSRFPMGELSVMGLAEVLPRAGALLARVRETARAVEAARPDALITIDSPDFCLRVAKRARAAVPDLRVIHYVAPSVWAWRPGRAAKMARHVDHVLALLPFEPPYMQAAGMTCDFVGHPVTAEAQATADEIAALRAALALAPSARLVAVLPGSRSGEVARLAPVFRAVADRLLAADANLSVVVPAAGPVAEMITGQFAGARIHVLDPRGVAGPEAERRKRAAFAAAEAALAASGTVSLELAAAGTPMVIAYSANWLTAQMVKRMVRVETATLVNLVTQTRAVPEFLFEACTPDRIAPALAHLLQDRGAAEAQRAVASRALDLLGRGGPPPGERAAASVLAVVDRNVRR